MCPGTIAEYGISANSDTKVTATPGHGDIRQRRRKTKCAFPAPTKTTCFSIGAVSFIKTLSLRHQHDFSGKRPLLLQCVLFLQAMRGGGFREVEGATDEWLP